MFGEVFFREPRARLSRRAGGRRARLEPRWVAGVARAASSGRTGRMSASLPSPATTPRTGPRFPPVFVRPSPTPGSHPHERFLVGMKVGRSPPTGPADHPGTPCAAIVAPAGRPASSCDHPGAARSRARSSASGSRHLPPPPGRGRRDRLFSHSRPKASAPVTPSIARELAVIKETLEGRHRHQRPKLVRPPACCASSLLAVDKLATTPHPPRHRWA